ncbi:hypothetical protein CBR_g21192 [Chara braunii]|uniref:Uncharacterized protein n=1 Tax=Chara braunii TaxID=69332 RepID=A0A388L0X1_CHABU|nr:hypothetical protein CBR_g21192 [Chara braunii]|eukprot:GBG75950.1 hypothetical protein CBR_g21192 [Chara braunii]
MTVNEFPVWDRKRYAMEDNPVIGIDLGTSYCCVAIFRNIDDIEIVPNDLGHRTTPSYVAFTSEGDCLVGDAAKKHSMTNPKEAIFEVKRLMGQSFNDAIVQQDAKKWPFTVSSGPRGEVVLNVPEAPAGRQSSFRPEEISTLLLKKMKEIAEDFNCGRTIKDAVITVPAYFSHSQRKATMAAGVGAGLNVLRLMSEPTAAALAYGHQRLIRRGPVEKNILVFDLGGGTFDVSIVTVKAGPDEDCSFVVRATAGDSHLGGSDIDHRLLQHVTKRFESQVHGVDLLTNHKILPRLKQAVVDAKHVLSGKGVTVANVNLDYREDVLSMKLGRLELEELNKDLFLRCVMIVEQALSDAKMGKDDISEVVLAGGSTRIPMVQEMLTAFFGKAPIKSVNPDEVVAFGAAVQAGLLARSDKCAEASISVHDVTSASVGLICSGMESKFGVMAVVIPRDSSLPATGSRKYVLEDGEKAVTAWLYEGERALCRKNRLLGELTMDDFMGGEAPQEAAWKVAVKIDAHGILHATLEALAHHKNIGRKVETTVT